jgi:hypothetical protein
MFAARITLAHFSVSSAMSLPKSAGGPGVGLPIELVDDFSGRVLGRTNIRPSAGFVPRQEVAYHGNVR